MAMKDMGYVMTRFVSNLFLKLLVPIVYVSPACTDDWFPDMAKILPPKPIAVICVNDLRVLEKDVSQLPLWRHPAGKAAWQRIFGKDSDFFLEGSEDTVVKLLEAMRDSLREEVFRKELALVIYPNDETQFDVTLIADTNADEDECAETLAKLNRMVLQLIFDAGIKSGPANGKRNQQTELDDSVLDVDGKKILETRHQVGDVSLFEWQPIAIVKNIEMPFLNHEVLLSGFVDQNRIVVSTSRQRAIAIADLVQNKGRAQCLDDDRRFKTMASLLRGTGGQISIQVDPQYLNRVLPELPVNIWPALGVHEVPAVGARIKILEVPDKFYRRQNEIQPVIFSEVIATMTFPRQGALKALAKSRKLESPPFLIEEPVFFHSINLEWVEIYRDFVDKYDQIHDKGDWDLKLAEIKTEERLEYDPFDDWISGMSGSRGAVQEVGFGSITFARFESADFAQKFAQLASQSGFHNREFPFEETEIGGFPGFVRSEKTERMYLREVRQHDLSSNLTVEQQLDRRQAKVIVDDWLLEGRISDIRHVLQRVGKARLPVYYEAVIDRVKQMTGESHDPFMFLFRKSRYWDATFKGAMQSQLKFAQEKRSPGLTMKGAPTTELGERRLMLALELLTAVQETMGEVSLVATAEESHVRISCLLLQPPLESDVPIAGDVNDSAENSDAGGY